MAWYVWAPAPPVGALLESAAKSGATKNAADLFVQIDGVAGRYSLIAKMRHTGHDMAAQRGGSGRNMAQSTHADSGGGGSYEQRHQSSAARTRGIKVRPISKARLLGEIVRRWFCRNTFTGRLLSRHGLIGRKTQPVAMLRCCCAVNCDGGCDLDQAATEARLADAANVARRDRLRREWERETAERAADLTRYLLAWLIWMALGFAWLVSQQTQAEQHKPVPPAVVREDDEPSAAIVAPIAFHFARY